jgi:hypothetical protein
MCGSLRALLRSGTVPGAGAVRIHALSSFPGSEIVIVALGNFLGLSLGLLENVCLPWWCLISRCLYATRFVSGNTDMLGAQGLVNGDFRILCLTLDQKV